MERRMPRPTPFPITLCLSVLLATGAPAAAQTSPARGPIAAAAPAPTDDAPLADYLALLQHIAPAAEVGTRTYLAALRLRCGRSLDLAALRRALADDGGDPALMGLIRAEAMQDRAARQRLVAQLPCPGLERP
jgi:hypothetical protein